MAVFERGYGLIIGVSEYSNPEWNVPIAERDAEAIHTALTDPQIGAYDRGRVRLLLGKEATRDRIAEELRILSEQAEPESTVFISFTGHGAMGDDKLYYLGSSDAQISGDLRLIRKNSGYNIARMASALQTIKAQKLLLIINACASGHLSDLAVKGGLGSTVISESSGKQILESGRGRALITASRPDERSYFQKTDTYSYFGRALVNGLKGQDVSAASGYVGLFELYNATYGQVQKATAALGYAQHPRITLVDGEGAFPVARYPGSPQGDPRLIQQTPPTGSDVRMIQIQYSDNRKVIDFGSAQIGSVTFKGDVAQGDIIKTYHGGQPADQEERIDPLVELPKIQQRVEVARNVDEDARDSAAEKVGLALRTLTRGDRAKAVEHIDKALAILDAMGNGYINSAARKLRKVREAIAS
ncbi:hypothetical protein EKD04_002025 [Chloroflexales bacterium ZM16-3]|nr:hypothetical protein [Chloroflexales bacterium ZM16-3]